MSGLGGDPVQGDAGDGGAGGVPGRSEWAVTRSAARARLRSTIEMASPEIGSRTYSGRPHSTTAA